MVHLTINGGKGKFELGNLYLTRGVSEECGKDTGFSEFVQNSISRHASGDWGDMSEDDKKENEYSVDKQLRIFSAYNLKDSDKKVWIITEADRSATTVLFPDEY